MIKLTAVQGAECLPGMINPSEGDKDLIRSYNYCVMDLSVVSVGLDEEAIFEVLSSKILYGAMQNRSLAKALIAAESKILRLERVR